MKKEIKKYIDKKLAVFSVNITQKKHKSGAWKKEINFPQKWTDFTLKSSFYNKDYNGIAILTGKINGIIVIDIDNTAHWKQLLKEQQQSEPKTVKAVSGSGGFHYYFKYDPALENITSKDHCFGKDYDIDIKTNGGCVIAPPTQYYNNNLEKDVEYKWEKSIFDTEMLEVPDWIKELLFVKKIKKVTKKIPKEENNKLVEETKLKIKENIKEDENTVFTHDDIEQLVKMLSVKRCENYNDWISVGMCLFNLDITYLHFWRNWSKQSDKYETGTCETKWKSFKKAKDGLKIGTLLLWCREDNKDIYNTFMKRQKINTLIVAKFPKEKLLLGKTVIVNDKCNYTHLHNKDCLIKGANHMDLPDSMYVEMVDKFMTIKCRHADCFGKVYPCQHVQLSKNEMNVAFHGDVNITINNGMDNELVEFQKIEIFEDPEVNELVFNSLNGKPYQLAEIIYYFYENDFNYGEDEDWYIYQNHKWENIGKKNMNLRHFIHLKLKELYSELLKYYKENEFDKQKIKTLKNTINTFGETTLKNNIMIELAELYTINKNPKRDFIKKLDSDNFLIGFDNGVYDLHTFEFREGNPNDYITMTVGYDYVNKHTNKYNDLIKFLEDIQPNKLERDYMLTYLSIGLVGNLLELFTILTGCGRNGKSKLIELLKYTFGDYFGSVQSQLFTRSRPDANSPDPGLLSLAKKRIVIASEPEKNSKLNSGFIKFITGRDSTTLRNCHSNDMIDFTAKFITLLICNDIPECDDIDNAFSKRLRCINFPTEFVNEPNKENQKKIDVNINANFDYWKLDFMLLLIEYYKKYTNTHELKSTTNILKWTDQYKENTDLYLQFLNETIKETKNEKDKIHCSVLYENFKIWFKNNNPNTKIPSSKEFGSNLRKYKEIKERVRVDEKIQQGIEGYKLIDQNNEFIHNELNAKKKCCEIFGKQYSTCMEYPLFYYNDTNTNTIDRILDIKILPTYENCVKNKLYPIGIIDVICVQNNKIVFGLEIKHAHKVDYEKIQKIKEMVKKSVNKINIYEIDASYILNNNINNIDENFKKII
jgi:P4 family phage/plasmid primase-like protien